MTAEVTILNRYGVALAADSATTITPKMKTYNSANKLFSLSKYTPVGIMIYGGAEMMGIPWEAIIKEYRRQLGQRTFKTLAEYAEDFLNFTRSLKEVSSEIQDDKFEELAGFLYKEILEAINSAVEELFEQKPDVDESEIVQVVTQKINDYDQTLSASALLDDFSWDDVDELTKKYSKRISKIISDRFDKLVIPNTSRRKLRRLLGKFVVTQNDIEERWRDNSGIVIAGFGDDELFPCLVEYQIKNVLMGKLRYTKAREAQVDTRKQGMIIPFAQSDMLIAFMEGIDPYYLFVIRSYTRKLFRSYTKTLLDAVTLSPNNPDGAIAFDNDELNNLESETDKLLQRFMSDLDQYRSDRHSNPILTALSFLGKSELAEMAEALVNLASFKKRMTLEAETVGGPIDVAVISKGDGLIWIKRKHYFDPRLNHTYFANYFGSTFIQQGENSDDQG